MVEGWMSEEGWMGEKGWMKIDGFTKARSVSRDILNSQSRLALSLCRMSCGGEKCKRDNGKIKINFRNDHK